MTTLDRERFEYLYLNANSIAELAFLRALDNAVSTPRPRTPESLAMAKEFEHALNNPDPATFDWSALEGVYGFDGALDATQPAAGDEVASEAVRAPSFEAMVGFDEDEDLDAPIDIARYLERVEEARPSLQSRIDDCFARADIPALEAALASLPADRASLTGALAPDAFERWLEFYETHHEGMDAAVMGIRQLEPMLQG